MGRRQGLALVLPADSVSKDHAEIYLAEAGLGLRDLGSKNGPFLGEERIDQIRRLCGTRELRLHAPRQQVPGAAGPGS